MIIQGETFIAVSDQALLAAAWCARAEQHIQKYSSPEPIPDEPQVTSFLARLQPQYVQTPFQAELERSQTQIRFSKHTDDGTLRLYKPDSLIGDEPAGYSEERVSVKIWVKRSDEEFLVAIKTTRTELDRPGAEDYLAQAAYRWRNR